MAELRDPTGRPGPSTWELGDYPKGQEDFPVNGVSWYKATAYAEFAGRTLPTVYEWKLAAGTSVSSDILDLSNFKHKGPTPVGTFQGIGPNGTYDMAGNVKEWCWNATGKNRYILGGGWDEPVYLYTDEDMRPPFDRAPMNGFRLVKHFKADPLPDVVTRPIERLIRDYSKEKPVSDEIFQVYKSLYAYDRRPLEAQVEEVDRQTDEWSKERISFNAGYGQERVTAYLFLPRNAKPPYQTVIYFPHAGIFVPGSSRNLDMFFLDFIIKSGRAVMFPIYKGTYERYVAAQEGTSAERDMEIAAVKDFSRSLDYLETRPELDHDKLAYYGASFGSRISSIVLAIDKRPKLAVLVAGGFRPTAQSPEISEINYAPRVKIPVLMINGRYDFIFPWQSSQNPFHKAIVRTLG